MKQSNKPNKPMKHKNTFAIIDHEGDIVQGGFNSKEQAQTFVDAEVGIEVSIAEFTRGKTVTKTRSLYIADYHMAGQENASPRLIARLQPVL